MPRTIQAVATLEKYWFSQGSLDMAGDEELLRLAAASGCLGMFIGLESLSPRIWRRSGKGKPGRYQAGIGKIHRHGIAIEGAFYFWPG